MTDTERIAELERRIEAIEAEMFKGKGMTDRDMELRRVAQDLRADPEKYRTRKGRR